MIGTFCTKCHTMVRVLEAAQCDQVFDNIGTGPCLAEGCDGKVVPLHEEQAFSGLLPGGKYLGEVRGDIYLRFLMGLGPYQELDIRQEQIDALFASGIIAIDGELQPSGYVVRSLVFKDGTRALLGPDFASGAAVIYRIAKGEQDGGDAQNAGAPGDQPGAD
jgi:hypothetical protein